MNGGSLLHTLLPRSICCQNARLLSRWLLLLFGASLERSDFSIISTQFSGILEAVSTFTVLRGWSAFGPNYVTADRQQ